MFCEQRVSNRVSREDVADARAARILVNGRARTCSVAMLRVKTHVRANPQVSVRMLSSRQTAELTSCS